MADTSLFLESCHLPPQSCKHLMQTNSSWLNWKTIEETTEKSRRRITVTQLRCLQVKKQTKKTKQPEKKILQKPGAEIGTKQRTTVQTSNHTEVFQLTDESFLLPDYQDLLLAALGPAPEITSIQTLNLHAVSAVIVAAGDKADKKQKLKAVCTNRALLSEGHKKISVVLLLQDIGRKSL